MATRTLGGWQAALRGIAAGLLWAQVANGQGTSADAGEPGDCTPSGGPHECAERCPSFDTCFIAGGDGQLYYRVMNQRFSCDGLDCTAASVQLGDYCCRRGDYAPSRGGGGGCALASPASAGAAGAAWAAGALGALGLLVARRRVWTLERGAVRPAPPG